jgi:hypothetical protein
LQDALRSEQASRVISELVEMLYRYNVAQATEVERGEVRGDDQVDLVSISGDKTSSAAIG